MATPFLTITAKQGIELGQALRFTSSGGVAVDLSGYIFSATLWGSFVGSFTVDATQADHGILTLRLPASVTEALPATKVLPRFDLDSVDSQGVARRWLRGALSCEPR